MNAMNLSNVLFLVPNHRNSYGYPSFYRPATSERQVPIHTVAPPSDDDKSYNFPQRPPGHNGHNARSRR